MNKTSQEGIPRARRKSTHARPLVSLISVVGAVLSFATSASAQAAPRQVQSPPPLPPPVVAAPASVVPSPPSPPVVTYEKGLLTISASNSTLRDILLGIRRQTGAEIDIPPQAEDRVFTRLGPGPPRDVVHSLLVRFPRFNYLIVGSRDDPNRLGQVVLFAGQLAGPPSRALVAAAGGGPPPTVLPTESKSDEESVQPTDNPQEPALPVRAAQQMLQQHRQQILEELNRRPE